MKVPPPRTMTFTAAGFAEVNRPIRRRVVVRIDF
jgi:hypothetical protein